MISQLLGISLAELGSPHTVNVLQAKQELFPVTILDGMVQTKFLIGVNIEELEGELNIAIFRNLGRSYPTSAYRDSGRFHCSLEIAICLKWALIDS